MKYSPRKTTIEVTIKIDEDDVVVNIVDHGTGIPNEHLSKIFERYYRVQYLLLSMILE